MAAGTVAMTEFFFAVFRFPLNWRLWLTLVEPTLTKQVARCGPIKARLKPEVNSFPNLK